MKDKWISIEEFSSLSGLATNTLYSMISRTKHTDPHNGQKYKKEGIRRLVNIAWFLEQDKKIAQMQDRFETAYYIGIENYGNEYALSRAVANKMDISAHTVSMYLRDHFLINISYVTDTRVKYIEALERVVESIRETA